MTTQPKLTRDDIERYASKFGATSDHQVGVLTSVVYHLMSDDPLTRIIAESQLREWAGGRTPKEGE